MNQKRTVSDTVPFSEKMGYSHEREADANEKIRENVCIIPDFTVYHKTDNCFGWKWPFLAKEHHTK